MPRSSVISGIVHEQLEIFWKETLRRLEEEGPNLATSEDIQAAKEDLKTTIALRFGRPTAASCISFNRGPTSWNGFYRDNFKRKWDEMMEENGQSIH
jgi:hypothetical protein